MVGVLGLGALPGDGLAQGGVPELDRVEMTLPRGDAEAGREAFVELRCTACHTVSGATDLPAPISTSPGPELGPDLGPQPLGLLATAIVTPSHAMSVRTGQETRAQVEGALSPMADYADAMTVRQLVDLLAYLDEIRQ